MILLSSPNFNATNRLPARQTQICRQKEYQRQLSPKTALEKHKNQLCWIWRTIEFFKVVKVVSVNYPSTSLALSLSPPKKNLLNVNWNLSIITDRWSYQGRKREKGKQITAFDNSLFSSFCFLRYQIFGAALKSLRNVDILTHESRAQARKRRKKNVDTERSGEIGRVKFRFRRLETVILI